MSECFQEVMDQAWARFVHLDSLVRTATLFVQREVTRPSRNRERRALLAEVLAGYLQRRETEWQAWAFARDQVAAMPRPRGPWAPAGRRQLG